MKKFIKIIILLVTILVIFLLIKNEPNEYKDTVKFNGKTYVLLEYNMDIFTYHFNSNSYYEEDEIHPVNHNKWDIVYFNGDLFVIEDQVNEATKYYADDKNYEWYIVLEKDEKELRKSISIDSKELEYLYNIERIKKTNSITFNDIKQFVDIVKTSKDGFIFGLINLIEYEDNYYWKTEIMNNYDEEYIVDIPKSLNAKIFDIVNKLN